MQCFHCGRAVRETIHTQKSYKVDYYLLHTGYSEWSFFINPKQDALPLRYLRLIQPLDIITCVQCYDQPYIRQKIEDDFTNCRPCVEWLQKDSEANVNSKG
jgi:hypothetical protein